MQSLRELIKKSAVSLGIVALAGGAVAAEMPSRATSSVGAAAVRMSSQRMPTMPTLPITGVGNMSPDLPSDNKPTPPDNPDNPDKPDKPDVPDEPDKPKPDTECPDGGVKNSEYTVDKCMNDIYACVNGGGLPGGITDMFDEDVRNSIVNGMNLCQVQVRRCVSDVRKNCKNVYNTSADVWIDFNSRKVQPDYYNFVLRKTGLTPNQAKNTCLLLDVNTYGPSFAAVAMNDNTTAEYNKKVGAYNGQGGGALVKKYPMGPTVNKGLWNTVDGGRGHYARWDAKTAECHLRVAAYNKDSHIKNSWLFGAAGDDKPAEVWRPAGSTFTCNKDLFGFSLMNNTSTAAVVGIGGGALVGTGVGALVGHGKRALDCNNGGHRKKIAEQVRAVGGVATLNRVLKNPLGTTVTEVTVAQCEEIAALRDWYDDIKSRVDECLLENSIVTDTLTVEVVGNITAMCEGRVTGVTVEEANAEMERCLAAAVPTIQSVIDREPIDTSVCADCNGSSSETISQCLTRLYNELLQNKLNSIVAPSAGGSSKCCFNDFVDVFKNGTDLIVTGEGVTCNDNLPTEMSPLGNALDAIAILDGEKSNMGKSIGIGAAIGVGAGGTATAITAIIEHSNINCRVGDDLVRVGFGKSHAIDTLKDFYVKWNLRLPDTIAPTGTATDCASWRSACAQMTSADECTGAVLNWRPDAAGKISLVRAACTTSGSACIENRPVAKSYGACE